MNTCTGGVYFVSWLMLTSVLVSNSAIGQEPSIPPAQLASETIGDMPPDDLIAERLSFIENSFNRRKVYSNIWWWGWSLGQLTASAVYTSLAVVQKDEPGKLPINVITASQALIGGVIVLAFPLESAFVSRKLDNVPNETATDAQHKLSVGEQYLLSSAKGQRMGRHWINHVLGFALAATGGLLLTFAFDDTDWRDGLINFGISFVTTELCIWTQPTHSIKDLKRYRETYGEIAASNYRSRPQLTFSPGIGSFAMGIQF